ncbi:MAG: OmpA family protein [Bacteroidetes bacterium]|nr:OmpA family protein [Bacteroidota bacterium]
MKYLLLLILGFITHVALIAQNIVVNSDLEDVNICVEHDARCSPAGWFYFKADPAGYLNPGTPNKTISASGIHHFNLLAVGIQDSARDYWETKLLCPVEPGKKYTISLKISSTWADPNLKDIGFWFTNKFIYTNRDTLLHPDKYIDFLDAKVKSMKNGWFLINKEITVSDTASILVIGNFTKEKNSEIILSRHRDAKPISIFVDDIQITCDKATPCIIHPKLKDSLYALKRRHSKIEPIQPVVTTIQKPIFQDTTKTKPIIDTFSINSIQFALDDSRITDKSVVKMLSPLTQKKDAIEKMEVIGYTDDLGTEEHNWELSKNRAASVIKLLVEEIGIDPKIISVRGEGISRKYEQKDLNRRVDIFIYWK